MTLLFIRSYFLIFQFFFCRSEIHQPSIQIRFGLVLESFCRGCGPYLKMLTKQVEALDKLTKLTNMIKNEIKDVCIYTD